MQHNNYVPHKSSASRGSSYRSSPEAVPGRALRHLKSSAKRHFLTLVEVMFIGFLLIVLVHIGDNAVDSAESRATLSQRVADGDTGKQVTYVLIFLGTFSCYLIANRNNITKCISVFQMALFAWIFFSCSWASDSFVAFRRATLLVIIFMSLAFNISILGPSKAMQGLYIALAICMVGSLVSVPLFSFAVHPADEQDASIVGAWRGILGHKNIAGGVCGMAIILYLHFSINRGRWHDWALLLVSIVFMIGTRSKTSIGFLGPVILVGLAYRYLWRSSAGRVAFLYLTLLLVAIGGLTCWAMWDTIVEVFNDPMSFTGRIPIWQAATAEIMDHPLTGAGYSSFWASGRDSDLYHYLFAPFLAFASHSHNGYLEMAATTGLPGLTLAVTASIIVPIRQVLVGTRRGLNYRAMFLSILLFGALQNLLETQLYSKDREVWVILASVILIVQMEFRGWRMPEMPRFPHVRRARSAQAPVAQGRDTLRIIDAPSVR